LRHRLDLLSRRLNDADYFAALAAGTPRVALAIDDTTAAELLSYEQSRLAQLEVELKSSKLDAEERQKRINAQNNARRKIADLKLRAAEITKHAEKSARIPLARRELQALRVEQRKQESEVRRTLLNLEDQIEEEVRQSERMGYNLYGVELQGAGRYGTMSEPKPVDQSTLPAHKRHTAASEQPAIDPVHSGLVRAQQRALKRMKDAELAAKRDEKRRTVFELLGQFQQGKLEQRVAADAEEQAELARIAAAKRDGTYVASAEEEARRVDAEKRRRTLPMHVRMRRDINFQQNLARVGQNKGSQMVLKPKQK
jgi:hypothetical protein